MEKTSNSIQEWLKSDRKATLQPITEKVRCVLWDMAGTQKLWRDIASLFAFSHPLAGDLHLRCQLRVHDGCRSSSHSICVLSLDRRTAEEQEQLLAPVGQSSSVCSPLTASMSPWPPASVERRVPETAFQSLTLCISNRELTCSVPDSCIVTYSRTLST